MKVYGLKDHLGVRAFTVAIVAFGTGKPSTVCVRTFTQTWHKRLAPDRARGLAEWSRSARPLPRLDDVRAKSR